MPIAEIMIPFRPVSVSFVKLEVQTMMAMLADSSYMVRNKLNWYARVRMCRLPRN